MATAERLIRQETITNPEVWTDKALMALSGNGVKVELVDGEPQMSQSTFIQGIIEARMSAALTTYVVAHDLGFVCGSSTAFWMKSGNTRAPDVSFTTKARFKGKALPRKYMRGAPALVIEVLSPHDTLIGLAIKMREYFDSGAQMAWAISPEDQTVLVYDSARPDHLLKVGDTLDGGTVLPGFSLPVAELFAGIVPRQRTEKKKVRKTKKSSHKSK